MRPVLQVVLLYNTTTKRIRKCQVKREHINHRREKEKTSMALESAWPLLTEERFLLEEELKEEKRYLYPLSRDTKNND